MKYFMLVILFASLGSFPNFLSAQTDTLLKVLFQPIFNNKSVLLTKNLTDSAADSIDIEVLKFYISQVELYQKQKIVFEEANSFHLLDISNPESFRLFLEVPKNISFDQIHFNVGIDSMTNISGAFGGDLDPTNGMYWTWQSGYINFKLEGTAEKCPARHHRFQFHIGGYQTPYTTIQKVQIPTHMGEYIKIDMNMDTIFENIDIEYIHNIVSPNEQAVFFSKLIPDLFSISR